MLPPETEWHLYDPKPFCKELSKLPNCRTVQDFYKQEHEKYWSQQQNVLFLCDIRDTEIGKLTEKITISQLTIEKLVENDMNTQKKFVQNTQAEMSVLKLRLPYPVKGGKYESAHGCTYLLGTNYFQPFNRHNSTECRLTCIPANVQSYRASNERATFAESLYNVSIHERKCAFLNTEKRPKWDYQAASKIYVNYIKMMKAMAEGDVRMTADEFVSELSAGDPNVKNAIGHILDNEIKEAEFSSFVH
jgi:hypothetical protein